MGRSAVKVEQSESAATAKPVDTSGYNTEVHSGNDGVSQTRNKTRRSPVLLCREGGRLPKKAFHHRTQKNETQRWVESLQKLGFWGTIEGRSTHSGVCLHTTDSLPILHTYVLVTTLAFYPIVPYTRGPRGPAPHPPPPSSDQHSISHSSFTLAAPHGRF